MTGIISCAGARVWRGRALGDLGGGSMEGQKLRVARDQRQRGTLDDLKRACDDEHELLALVDTEWDEEGAAGLKQLELIDDRTRVPLHTHAAQTRSQHKQRAPKRATAAGVEQVIWRAARWGGMAASIPAGDFGRGCDCWARLGVCALAAPHAGDCDRFDVM